MKLQELFKIEIKDYLKEFEKDLKNKLISFYKMRVPIDTLKLQNQGIEINSFWKDNTTLILKFGVKNQSLKYKYQSINALTLGIRLDSNRFKRSKSQPKNPINSPTLGWFSDDFVKDVLNYLNSQNIDYVIYN